MSPVMCVIQYYIRIRWVVGSKKITNGVLCNIVYRLYQGILDYQNAIRFHGTRLNIFFLTPTRRSFLFPVPIPISLTRLNIVMSDPLYRISPASDNKCMKDRNSFTPLSKGKLYTASISTKPTHHSNFCGLLLYQIFIQNDRKYRKCRPSFAYTLNKV